MGNHHRKLTLQDRAQIQELIRSCVKQKDIARHLKVHPSTISREIRRFKEDGTRMDRFTYNIAESQCSANRLREKSVRKRKIIEDEPLYKEIMDCIINKHWSPEQVSGHLRRLNPFNQCVVSHETIYKYIYSMFDDEKRQLWIRGLRQKKKKRRPRKEKIRKRGRIRHATSIHQRPEEVENRETPGHWEGDLVIGANHSSAIGTLVERTTRYTVIVKIEGKRTSENVVKSLAKQLSKIPKALRKSVTYDNGLEMANHELFTELTGMAVYFADVGTPSQRGTNENTNGLIREFYPKRTNFNQVTVNDLKSTESLINKRPRKCLGYHTPDEFFEKVSQARAPPGRKKDSNPGN